MKEQDFDRLFRNILSNANKYNKEYGKIKIILTSSYLEVSNTLIGISS